MEREEFIRKMLMLGAELGETSDNIRISMIVNDAELLTKKYESELKKLRVTDVSVCACGSDKYYIEQYKDVTKYYCSKCHEKIESKH